MRVFGLIGFPLGHSFSQGWFRDMFALQGITDAQYLNLPLADIGGLPALLDSTPDLCGLNVTAPYKQAVIPYLDELSADAAAIGAVNCIVIRRCEPGKAGNYRLSGHNTDWQGFRDSLIAVLGEERPGALILGSGGAAKAAAYALHGMGIDYLTVSSSRSGNGYISYAALTPAVMASHRLIINATPLGTYPAVDTMPPLPYDLLDEGHVLYDMVYNPPLTRFLIEGQSRGCRVKNGTEMLHRQAELSWELFAGT